MKAIQNVCSQWWGLHGPSQNWKKATEKAGLERELAARKLGHTQQLGTGSWEQQGSWRCFKQERVGMSFGKIWLLNWLWFCGREESGVVVRRVVSGVKWQLWNWTEMTGFEGYFYFFLVLPVYCYQPISLPPRAHMLSHVTPWTAARQAPLSMDFPRQEYWSGLPFPSPWGIFLERNLWLIKVQNLEINERSVWKMTPEFLVCLLDTKL